MRSRKTRIHRYVSLDEAEIPEIDSFYIAEYNEVNKGFVFAVRNYDKDSFVSLSKKQIKPKHQEVADKEDLHMEDMQKANRLARTMYQMGAQKDLVLGVLAILETEDNCEKMLQELAKEKEPSRTWIIGTAMLIAEPEEIKM